MQDGGKRKRRDVPLSCPKSKIKENKINIKSEK